MQITAKPDGSTMHLLNPPIFNYLPSQGKDIDKIKPLSKSPSSAEKGIRLLNQLI